MSCPTTTDSSTIPVLCEQRLEFLFAGIHQKLNDLIYKEEVNQLWKLGVESTLHSIWSKVCYQRACVSTSSQTDDLFGEDCHTSLESPIYFNETSLVLQEEKNELNYEELHNVVEAIPKFSSSSSPHESEISASFAFPEQPIKHGNANGGNVAKHVRFCSDRQKEHVHRNKTSGTLQEQDNSFASSAEEENEFNGEEQQDVVDVIPSSSPSAHKNELSVSDASPEQPTQRANKSRSNPVKYDQSRRCTSKSSRKVDNCEMSLHEQTHGTNPQPPFKCSFKVHLRFCSSRPNENGSFDCAECGKSYITRRKLISHLQHHTEKKYKCAVCGRAFIGPSHVNAHMVTHTRAKSFHCELCQTSYSTPSTLRRHIRLFHANKEENT